MEGWLEKWDWVKEQQVGVYIYTYMTFIHIYIDIQRHLYSHIDGMYVIEIGTYVYIDCDRRGGPLSPVGYLPAFPTHSILYT